MKKTVQSWAGIVVLILVILCADMNFNRSARSTISATELRALNLFTIAAILILMIWRFRRQKKQQP